MGTRGAVGFYKNEVTKVTYNHFDSYPGGLGIDVLNFLRITTVQELNEIFDRIILVSENDTPTLHQIEECIEFYDSTVGTQSQSDWYCLLREAQGNLNAFKKINYMIDSKNFLQDSLFCEWAYIINLDKNVLEIYKGFNKDYKKQGERYKTENLGQEWFSVALLVEINLKEIPSDNEFLEKLKDDED